MDLCFLFYVCVDEETRRLFQPGPGALMANLDIESTYRQIPVHPDNRHLLGVRWMGVVYLDSALFFGLLSALKIFLPVADALLWIEYRKRITSGIYYLKILFFRSIKLQRVRQEIGYSALQVYLP